MGSTSYISTDDGISVIDISDPSDPVVILEYNNQYVHSSSDIMVVNNYAYMGAMCGLRIFDMSNPDTIIPIGYYNKRDYRDDIAMQGNYAYAVDEDAGLSIIDISDLEEPVETGFYSFTGEAHEVALYGNYAYLTSRIPTVRVLDISDPSSPVEIGSYDCDMIGTTIQINGNNAYIDCKQADWSTTNLVILDISDPGNPIEIAQLQTANRGRDLAVNDNYVYLASTYPDDGISVIDISDPQNPYESLFVDTPDGWDEVILEDHYLYLGNYSGIMEVYDTNTLPSNEIARYELEEIWDMTYEDGMLYISSGYYGLRLINVYEPWDPEETGWYEFTYEKTYGVSASGSIACVGYGTFFQIFDCSNGTHSSETSLQPIPSSFSLGPASPNPFNPSTTITINLPDAAELNVHVFNITGQRVAELANGSYSAGTHQFTFDASGMASGIYFVRATVPGQLDQTQKVLLVR
ncbi:LVIVD repeat protein [bacterium BMS3Bbin04]|nr:LVIVD repeat protein [bacterium BMS3Bbin04]